MLQELAAAASVQKIMVLMRWAAAKKMFVLLRQFALVPGKTFPFALVAKIHTGVIRSHQIRNSKQTKMSMTRRDYPEGVDCVWLASDGRGRLAAFVTGGVGPIPLSALNSELPPLEEVESLVCNLPLISNARLLVTMKRPDDFVAMAERGLFVYDWRDVHRAACDFTRAYELIAVPSNPIECDGLPKLLAHLASATKFDDKIFADASTLDARVYFECCEGVHPA